MASISIHRCCFVILSAVPLALLLRMLLRFLVNRAAVSMTRPWPRSAPASRKPKSSILKQRLRATSSEVSRYPWAARWERGQSIGARMLQGTKLGALLGAISGAGRGEDLSGRAFGAAIGAPLGAAVGGAAPVLIKGVEKVGTAAVRTAQPFVNAILERRSPEAKLVTARMTRAKRSANDGATVPSEEVNLFRPPKVRRRYEEDYPDGGQADARGNLLTTSMGIRSRSRMRA